MKKLKKTKTYKWIVPLVVLALSIVLYLGYMYAWEYHRHQWMSLDEICNTTEESGYVDHSRCDKNYCSIACVGGNSFTGCQFGCTPKVCEDLSVERCPKNECQILRGKSSGKMKCVGFVNLENYE